MFLSGLRIEGYRSFGVEAEFSGLSKVNIIVGQNNSGKSNVLRLLSRHFPDIFKQRHERRDNCRIKDIDFFGRQERPVLVSIYFSKDILIKSLENKLSKNNADFQLESFLSDAGDGFWIVAEYSKDGFGISSDRYFSAARFFQPNVRKWQPIWSRLTNQTGGGEKHWCSEGLKALDLIEALPHVVDFIPATRSLKQYEDAGLEQKGHEYVLDGLPHHSGIGLIDELFRLQNPPIGREADSERFEQINSFMKDVTGNSSVQLEVPHDKSTVVVNMDGKRLPISSLGAGIEEVLIIAAKSTIFSNQIVCLEEPELHLHPSLQKKLMAFLAEKTDNQYFITTHSAHLLDAVESSIYHVRMVDGSSRVVAAINDAEKFSACTDLGYRASDILQSNAIIWVEGPSDRIYLIHWLRSSYPELREGLHFSIMFYGGRLLSHLTASDDALDEFIKLQKLNRNMAIVIDSDKLDEADGINATKQRLADEFRQASGRVWITAGKEIENYLSQALLTEFLETECQGVECPEYGQYKILTRFLSKDGKPKQIDKLRLAHWVAKKEADASVLDLSSRIDELGEFVSRCNLIDV